MKKYMVVYHLPSGTWGTFTTDDKQEAEDYALSEQSRLGWPHRVVKL